MKYSRPYTYRYGDNGLWRVEWRLDGKKERKAGFATKHEALAYYNSIVGKLRGGLKKTVAWCVDEFLVDKWASVTAGTIERCTYDDYKGTLSRLVLTDEIAKINLIDLDTPKVNAFLKRLVVNPAISRSSAKRVRTHISIVLDWAVGQGYLIFNPAKSAKLERSKRQETDGKAMDIPSPAEVRAIMEAADRFDKNGRTGAQFRMLFYAGFRPGEMLGFPIDEMTVRPNRVVKLHVRQRAGNRYNEIGKPKSVASERSVYLAPAIGLKLLEYKIALKSKTGLMFPTASGKPISASNWNKRVWSKVLKNAGLEEKNYRPHHGRHFAVSAMISAGASPKEVQEFAGHADFKITMNVYGHLFKSETTQIDRAEKLAEFVGGKS